MLPFQMRAYGELVDFPLVRDFFVAIGADVQHTGTWHLGNLIIGLYGVSASSAVGRCAR